MLRLALLSLLVPLLSAGLAGCTPQPHGTTIATVPAVPARPNTNEYVIGAGDQLSVFVYQSPDLSDREVTVRPDGKISIPLVQDLPASGYTPPELAQAIAQRLKQYIKDPNVTVIVRSFVGPSDRQVKVIGEATEPKAIPYRTGMSLLDVMIDTKGLTKYAAGNRAIIVRRDSSGKEQEIHVHLSDLVRDGDMSQNVRMQPGDTLIIPQSWF
ncbi:MAG TPA: XrtA/PEP-CTERM system exopolysaccharide export protein [Acetobacteraceae bacterium]|nr:XrtA/PEP-CTERM system exopolysaccharide export protein [Acetobacteraceae bacterium]